MGKGNFKFRPNRNEKDEQDMSVYKATKFRQKEYEQLVDEEEWFSFEEEVESGR